MALMNGVYLIEGIPQYQNRNEGNLLFEFIQMMLDDKVTLWYNIQSYNDFFDKLQRNNHKFLHISCHGGIDNDDIVYLSFPRNMKIYAENFKGLRGIQGRNILITACEAGKSSFIKTLFEDTLVNSVIAPKYDIDFEDSAMWCVNYYYYLFKNKVSVGEAFDYMNEKFYIKGAFQLISK